MPTAPFLRPTCHECSSSGSRSTSATRGIPLPTSSTPHASQTSSTLACNFSTSSRFHPRLIAPRRCHKISRSVLCGISAERVTTERSLGSWARGSGVGEDEARVE